MQTEMREKQLNVRLSGEEAERFQRVADHFGLNIAGTIRMLFKLKARELGFEGSPALATVASQLEELTPRAAKKKAEALSAGAAAREMRDSLRPKKSR